MNDDQTTVNEMKSWVRQFCDERNWTPYHGPKDLAIGLVTEASELLEIFRFVREADLAGLMADPQRRQDMADELADSLYFILRFSEVFNFDLAKCLNEKLIKNAIKYPPPPSQG